MPIIARNCEHFKRNKASAFGGLVALYLFALSLFINDKFGVFAVCLVGADENEIRIGNNTEAFVLVGFTLKLIADVNLRFRFPALRWLHNAKAV